MFSVVGTSISLNKLMDVPFFKYNKNFNPPGSHALRGNPKGRSASHGCGYSALQSGISSVFGTERRASPKTFPRRAWERERPGQKVQTPASFKKA